MNLVTYAREQLRSATAEVNAATAQLCKAAGLAPEAVALPQAAPSPAEMRATAAALQDLSTRIRSTPTPI